MSQFLARYSHSVNERRWELTAHRLGHWRAGASRRSTNELLAPTCNSTLIFAKINLMGKWWNGLHVALKML